nr:uncharacterized protein LOC113736368 [Coffea arabica]
MNMLLRFKGLNVLRLSGDDVESLRAPLANYYICGCSTLNLLESESREGRGIEELGTLKYLKGLLEIRNLGLVKGKEAAKQAKLFEKPDLSRLTFAWELRHLESDNRDEDVLEGQLPSLKRLSLIRLDNIRFIGDEEEEEGGARRRKFFPALEELWVIDMGNLVEWKDADQVRSTVGEAEADETPSLEKFILFKCPKLIPHGFKGFAFATSLRELSINSPFSSDDSSVDDFDWSGLRSASTLRKLRLEGLPHTESLPHQLQYLTTLTSLSLADFGGIRVLPDWIETLCP